MLVEPRNSTHLFDPATAEQSNSIHLIDPSIATDVHQSVKQEESLQLHNEDTTSSPQRNAMNLIRYNNHIKKSSWLSRRLYLSE